jgi:hypothetical protein
MAHGGCVTGDEDVRHGAAGGARPDHPQHLVHGIVLPQGLPSGLTGVTSPRTGRERGSPARGATSCLSWGRSSTSSPMVGVAGKEGSMQGV